MARDDLPKLSPTQETALAYAPIEWRDVPWYVGPMRLKDTTLAALARMKLIKVKRGVSVSNGRNQLWKRA